MNNFNENQVEKAINQLAKEMNKSPEEIREMLNSKKAQRLISGIPNSRKKQIEEILNDENKIKEILNSPKARALMEKFKKG